MGGGGDGTNPLIIHILHAMLKSQGYKAQIIEQIRHYLVEQLEKQGMDWATRVRQSQSAQVLSCFLRYSGAEQDTQWLSNLRAAKEQLVRQLLQLDFYQHGHGQRNISLNPAKRIAQVLVLAARDPDICSVLNATSTGQLGDFANVLVQELAPRNLPGHPPVSSSAGNDARTMLCTIEHSLTRAKQSHVPNELYVSVTAQDSALKGVYRIDGQTMNAVNHAEQGAGLTYIKTIQHNVGYQIAKVCLCGVHTLRASV
jgi:hypothetical protein